MTETDDIVARLHNAERAQFRAGDWTWMPVHNADARRLFIEAATALAERDAQIERLTRERDEEAETAATNGRFLCARAETAERERDEARAALRKIANGREVRFAYGTTEVVDRDDASEIARAALSDASGKEG